MIAIISMLVIIVCGGIYLLLKITSKKSNGKVTTKPQNEKENNKEQSQLNN